MSQYFVAGAHGVVVGFSGWAFTVIVSVVLSIQDSVPAAMNVVYQVVPGVLPYLLVPLGIDGIVCTCRQEGRRCEAFGLNPEVFVAVANASIR